MDIVGANTNGMGNYSAVHLGIDSPEVVDLIRRIPQLIDSGSTGSAKGVVLQEFVGIEQVDLPDRCLRHQIEHVRASPPETDDGSPLICQPLGKGADADSVRGRLQVVEDTVLLVLRCPKRPWRRPLLQSSGRR